MDFAQLFEFKPGLEFFNSPLFLLIVVVIAGIYFAYIGIKLFLQKRGPRQPRAQKNGRRLKMKLRKSKEPQPAMVNNNDKRAIARAIISDLPGHQKEEIPYYPPEERKTKVNETDITSEQLRNEIKVMFLSVLKEIQEDGMKTQGFTSKNGVPKQSDRFIHKEQDYIEYNPHEKDTIMAMEAKKQELAEFLNEIKNVETKIDTLKNHIDHNIDDKIDQILQQNGLLDDGELKKKPKTQTSQSLTSRILAGLRKLGSIKVSSNKPQPSEKPNEKNVTPIEPVKPVEEPRPSNWEMPVPEGSSKRQMVFQMADEGRDPDMIYDATGWDQSMIKRYFIDWEDKKFKMIKEQFPDVNWNVLNKIIEYMKRQEEIIVKGNHLYHRGRDPLTYVFIAISLILGLALALSAT